MDIFSPLTWHSIFFVNLWKVSMQLIVIITPHTQRCTWATVVEPFLRMDHLCFLPDLWLAMWLNAWKLQRPLLVRSAFDSQLKACIWAVAQHSLWVACLPWFPLSRSVVLLSFFFCALSQSLHHIKSEGWALLCRWMLQENSPGVSHNQFPACLADFCCGGRAGREAFRLIGRHGAETPPSRHAVTLWFMGLFLSPFRFNGQYRQAAFSNIHSRSRATAPFCLPPHPFDRFPFPPARSPSIYAAMHDGVRMRTRQRANLLAAPEPSHQIRRWPFTFPWRVFARLDGQTSAPLRDVVSSCASQLTGSQLI